MRPFAIALTIVVFAATGVTIAQATGGGHSGGDHHHHCDAVCMQYKKKKFCDWILALYGSHHGWNTSSKVNTDYGYQTIAWLIKFCTGKNSPPDANCKCTGTVKKGKPVTFDGSESKDWDGYIVKYEWDTDGNGTYEATGKTVTKTYTSTGTKTVTLRVTDNDNATDKTTCSVTVKSY